jgi:hypothetical protein
MFLFRFKLSRTRPDLAQETKMRPPSHNIRTRDYIKSIPAVKQSKSLGLRMLGCWVCGFESRREPVCCPCCVWSGTGLWDVPVPRPYA